jgi:peptidoglycan/xylan/chitin deacetylase (PgdA/CDA1 family)
MEPTDDEGDSTSFGFFRPILLIGIFIAYTKTTRESRTLINYSAKPDTEEVPAVKSPPAPKKKKKKIYLTFDDGPNKGTRKVMNIFKQEQVPVTFFIIGEHVFASTAQHATWDSLKVMEAMDSVEICNHSNTHAWNNKYEKFYQHADSVVNDFQKCHDTLQLENNIVRTPGRNIWRVDTISFTDLKKSAAAADSLQQAGFVIIGWDLEWHYDHKSFSLKNKCDELMDQIDSLFARNKTKIPEHLVLLAHDQVYDDADDSCELHNLIKRLKARDDYELLVTSKYPGAKAGQ